MSARGFDISSNNGRNIDFRKAYRAGYRFVFIKVTEGLNYVNPYAKEHARQAKAAGLLVGGYCFVSPRGGRTGREEADYFWTHAREAGLIGPGTLRPAADIEITGLPAGKESRRYHYAFVERLTHLLAADNLAAGHGVSENHKPFIYTGSWFWDGVLGARNAHKCPLWLAAYSSTWKRYIPKAFKRGVSIHQYTDKGTVPGIAGHTDLNHYLGRNLEVLKRRHTLHRSK